MGATSTNATLKDELLSIVGARGLLEPEDFEGRSCDPYSASPILSPFVARPTSAAEVSELVKLCARRGLKVVTHGGRTGVSGGAFTSPDSIVISLERMTLIEEICEIDQVAVVQSGVPIEALHDAAAARGLLYPVDLGSKGSATVGGTIATNAGGNHVLRWGMTRQSVLGIEAVLADGTIVSALNRVVKNNTGYDLKHTLIGSEGTLGVITRAVVKLVPLPTSHEVAFVACDSIAQVAELLALARRMPALSAFEVMWADYYDLVATSNSARRPLEPGKPYYVLIEMLGYDQEADGSRFGRFIEVASDHGLISDGVLATSEQQRKDLWRVREASEIIAREFGPVVSFDVGVDIRSVERFVNEAYEALHARFPEARGITFGHLGDNNIHLGVTIGERTRERTIEIERLVFGVLERFGGALTAEHGVGQFKREFLPAHKTPGELEMMRRLRAGLDPTRRLNPDVM